MSATGPEDSLPTFAEVTGGATRLSGQDGSLPSAALPRANSFHHGAVPCF